MKMEYNESIDKKAQGPGSIENPVIRKADLKDVKQLSEIKLEREGGEFESHLAKFKKELSENDEGKLLLLVAEIGNNIVGFGRAHYFAPPPDPPVNIAPEGWYLMGVIVRKSFRRKGTAKALTLRRLKWLSKRASKAYYFTIAGNQASIDLHKPFGFTEITRDFIYPGITTQSCRGILFGIDL